MLNITKTTKFIAFAFLLAFVVPTTASAFKNDSWGDSYSDSGWDDYSGGSGSSYYYDTPSYDYSYDYTPDYSYDYGYNTPSYSTPSYNHPSSYYDSGYGYTTPTTYSYGGSTYPTYTYSQSTTPSSNYSNSVSNPISNSVSAATNNTKVSNTNNSSASVSGSNINNNVNNVYVYTNPTGNAVVYNPEYKKLDGYCVITPSNPRIGQTVTATAYITGGVGSYTYVWGGDLLSTASGVSTSFTSYTAGTKNITVTARSSQDVRTANCSVTFEREYTYVSQPYTYGSYTNSYTPTGASASGVYVQPAYINPGTSVSGVYLNNLPATGVDLNWMHYMIAFMVVVLATVATYVSKNKSKFTGVVDSE